MPIDLMSPVQAMQGALEKKLYNDQRVQQARYLADIRTRLHMMDNMSKERRANLGLKKEEVRQKGQKETAEIKANSSNKVAEENTKQQASKVEQQKEVTKQQKEVTKQEKEKTSQSNNKRLTANANARAERYKSNSSLASESATNSLQDEQNSIVENTLKRYGGVE